MTTKKTKKKITRVSGGDSKAKTGEKDLKFVPTSENKSKAIKFRIFASISWFIAIGFEVGGILVLRNAPVNTTALIIFIIVALAFAVLGSTLWKKANRFDPASEKEKVKFFIQNQLGLIISIIAFLPLIILIFTNKDLAGKQKTLVGSIAVIALIIAGLTGIDFNPVSQEQYLEQTEQVRSLMDGTNNVFWTKAGRSYHLFSDCSYINTNRTNEIFEGTVAQARELKNITDLCDFCERRATRDKEETTI